MYKIWLLILSAIRGTDFRLCQDSKDVFPVISPYDIVNRL